MTHDRTIYRTTVKGVHCRSAAELIRLKVAEVAGVEAVSLDENSVLTVFADRDTTSSDDIARALVNAGFAPSGDADIEPVAVAETDPEIEVLDAAIDDVEPVPPAQATLVQRVQVRVADDYYPNQLHVIPGVPVEIEFSEGHGCLSHVLFKEFGIDQDLTEGGAVVRLPGLAPGEHTFSCGMEMVFGRVVAGL